MDGIKNDKNKSIRLQCLSRVKNPFVDLVAAVSHLLSSVHSLLEIQPLQEVFHQILRKKESQVFFANYFLDMVCICLLVSYDSNSL